MSHSITDSAGTVVHYQDDRCLVLHRENGPAVECPNGDQYWYTNGQLHRIDGPAVDTDNGTNRMWWLCNKNCTEEQVKNINQLTANATHEALVELAVTELRQKLQNLSHSQLTQQVIQMLVSS